MTNLSIINRSTLVSDEQVQAIVPALQSQIDNDFKPIWGVGAILGFVSANVAPPVGSFWLVILDDTDQAGDLGYHDLTDEGLPQGKVFVRSALQAGTQWSVVVSHEILEMLVDPDINLAAFSYAANGMMTLFAYEVCDPVEGDQLGYQIGGVLVSDFVYPSWFESFWATKGPRSTQFDKQNHVANPFQLSPGGYISYFNVTGGSGWVQQHGSAADHGYETRARVGSRRERRRIPRDQWLRSKVKMPAGVQG